jgi:hypothetical protein
LTTAFLWYDNSSELYDVKEKVGSLGTTTEVCVVFNNSDWIFVISAFGLTGTAVEGCCRT